MIDHIILTALHIAFGLFLTFASVAIPIIFILAWPQVVDRITRNQ